MSNKGVTMNVTYGTRDITRNPTLLKIDPNDSFLVEDKRAGKRLGVYLGIDLADEFLAYKKRKKLLESARKIKKDAKVENILLEGTLDDEL